MRTLHPLGTVLLVSVVSALAGGPAGPACAGPPRDASPREAPPPRDAKAPTPAVLKIEETTMATVAGWRVTVGNIMRDRWRGPDGKEREGITAEVGVYDEQKKERSRQTLGEGGVVSIAGVRYLVARVQQGKAAGDNGFIELRAAQ